MFQAVKTEAAGLSHPSRGKVNFTVQNLATPDPRSMWRGGNTLSLPHGRRSNEFAAISIPSQGTEIVYLTDTLQQVCGDICKNIRVVKEFIMGNFGNSLKCSSFRIGQLYCSNLYSRVYVTV